jgi:hypothetical protein
LPLWSRKWPFLDYSVAAAPLDAGVYALWKVGEIIYIGASGVEARNSIRTRLLEHLKVCDGVTFPLPDHYSWEVANDPQQRKAELLVEYQRLHGGRLPQLNAGGN